MLNLTIFDFQSSSDVYFKIVPISKLKTHKSHEMGCTWELKFNSNIR